METNESKGVNQFLSTTRCHIKKHGIDTLVFGNEATDLDSVVSAIGLAWALTLDAPHCSALPLIPIERPDFRLKTESRWVLAQVGIDEDRLCFLDDAVRSDSTLDQFMTGIKELALVDHNQLSVKFSTYKNKVRLIVDHHEDQGLYPKARRRIARVGSCATLIGEILIHRKDTPVPVDLATLLLGAILIDTVNLDPMAGRATPRDRNVAGVLISLTGMDRDKYYQGICRAKSDIADLDTVDLLRRDEKTFQFGNLLCSISSVPLCLDQWIKKDPKLVLNLETRRRAIQADILITMNTCNTPEFSRDMAITGKDPALLIPLLKMLSSNGLDLTPMHQTTQESDGNTLFFNQKNPAVSRKKLIPMLARHFS